VSFHQDIPQQNVDSAFRLPIGSEVQTAFFRGVVFPPPTPGTLIFAR
jgi:hypothetical protein